MELKRRFRFRGNAAAFGGRLIRPVDIVIENSAAASLTVSGGRSRARVGPLHFGDEVRLESAMAFAEGLFDDSKQYEELTYQRGREELLTTSTHVVSEVTGLAIGLKPQLTVARVRGALRSTTPLGSGETPVWPTDESVIEGLAIEGHKLVVELNTPLFQRLNTHAKLLAAADDPAFVRENGDHLFMQAAFEGRAIPSTGRVVGCGYTMSTIVRRLRWDGTPFPGSQLDGNLAVVPGLGRLYFGEMLVTTTSKRLTMIRMELGSPCGGFFSCGEVEDNGYW